MSASADEPGRMSMEGTAATVPSSSVARSRGRTEPELAPSEPGQGNRRSLFAHWAAQALLPRSKEILSLAGVSGEAVEVAVRVSNAKGVDVAEATGVGATLILTQMGWL